jgi:hypothetical protein
MIRSAKEDSVVDTISEQAKEAAAQCSGTRPALIALHLVDQISRADLQTMLHTRNGLHSITHAVFKGANRLHVNSIAFTVPQTRRNDQSGARWLSGDLLMLQNPQPRFPCAEIRSIFRARREGSYLRPGCWNLRPSTCWCTSASGTTRSTTQLPSLRRT